MDEDKHAGLVGNDRLDVTLKKSIDMRIPKLNMTQKDNENWSVILEYLTNRIVYCIKQYESYIIKNFSKTENIWISELFEMLVKYGFQIQKTNPSGYFNWHTDFSPEQNRVLSIILYLNTLESRDEGETEFFIDGNYKQIKPEVGKVLIFPSTWTYLHRGRVVKNKDKYIISTFICI